jgi:hypothetical protein
MAMTRLDKTAMFCEVQDLVAVSRIQLWWGVKEKCNKIGWRQQ